jgi:hypothetical protein
MTADVIPRRTYLTPTNVVADQVSYTPASGAPETSSVLYTTPSEFGAGVLAGNASMYSARAGWVGSLPPLGGGAALTDFAEMLQVSVWCDCLCVCVRVYVGGACYNKFTPLLLLVHATRGKT